MKILLVCQYYAPDQTIGAVRWSKLCKYLTSAGYDFDVLCNRLTFGVDPLLMRDLPSCGNLLRVGGEDYTVSAASAPKAPPTGLKKMILDSRLFKLWQGLNVERYSTRDSLVFAEKALQLLEAERDCLHYDCIITSFGPVSNVLIALELHRRYPDIPILADFRDPMPRDSQTPLMRRRFARLQRKMCGAATRITSVSRDLLEDICDRSELTAKSSLLRNGFDTDDLECVVPPEESGFADNRFSMCYTGTIYDGRSDLSPLFAALAAHFESGLMRRERVVLHYAGGHFSLLHKQATAFGVEDVLVNHGNVTRGWSMALQQACRVVLLASFNNVWQRGVLTGKLYEYMMSGRPILTLVSGNLAGSELRGIIEEGKLGFVYEQAAADNDAPLLRDYLLRQYRLFEEGQPPEFEPVPEMIERFDYHNLAVEAARIIDETVGGRGARG